MWRAVRWSITGILFAGGFPPARCAYAGPATVPAAWPGGQAPSVVRIEETALYTKSDNELVADTVASADCRHVACLARLADGRFKVVVDGVRSKDIEWVVGHTLRFSPDSSRLTYQTQHDGKIFIAMGLTNDPAAAVESAGYFLAGQPVFSRDGKHVAYWAQPRQSGKYVMVVDDQPRGSYDLIDDQQIVFSPDGRRLAFRATRGRQQFLVIDGKEGPHCDAAVGVQFSGDSRRVGYRVKRGDQAFVIVDGHEGPHYDMVAGLTFSPDGRRLAYAAGRGQKQMLVMDDGPPDKPAPKQFLPFDGLGDISFSPDGRRLGITALTGKQWRVVIDGKASDPYDGTGPILFSRDSRRYAFVASRGRQQFMVIDGREEPTFTTIGTYTFTPDSAHAVYAVVRGQDAALYVDDHRFAPAGLFAFSPDGRHIVHSLPLPDKRWTIGLDAQPIHTADAAPLSYDGFPAGSDLIFDGPTTVRTIVGRGPQLLKVEISIGPPAKPTP